MATCSRAYRSPGCAAALKSDTIAAPSALSIAGRVADSPVTGNSATCSRKYSTTRPASLLVCTSTAHRMPRWVGCNSRNNPANTAYRSSA